MSCHHFIHAAIIITKYDTQTTNKTQNRTAHAYCLHTYLILDIHTLQAIRNSVSHSFIHQTGPSPCHPGHQQDTWHQKSSYRVAKKVCVTRRKKGQASSHHRTSHIVSFHTFPSMSLSLSCHTYRETQSNTPLPPSLIERDTQTLRVVPAPLIGHLDAQLANALVSPEELIGVGV